MKVLVDGENLRHQIAHKTVTFDDTLILKHFKGRK
jgi:hypothetical protein